MALAPAAPVGDGDVVSLEALKLFLRVDGGDEDPVIAQLRTAAIDWVERYTSKSLVRREWRWALSAFAPVLRLPREPVADDAAVTSIAYRDAAGAAQAVPAGGWIVSAGAVIATPGTVWPATWASDGAVTIVFEAGYEDVTVEAPGLVTAVMFQAKHLYDRGTGEAPSTVLSLCQPYRTPVIG